MTDQMRQRVPLWVLIYLGLTTAMVLAVTILGYVDPHKFFDFIWAAHATPGAFALAGPTGFFLGREIATVVIDLYALNSRTPGTVRMAMLMRGASDTMDAVHAVVSGFSPAVPAALVAISVVALWAMRNLRD